MLAGADRFVRVLEGRNLFEAMRIDHPLIRCWVGLVVVLLLGVSPATTAGVSSREAKGEARRLGEALGVWREGEWGTGGGPAALARGLALAVERAEAMQRLATVDARGFVELAMPAEEREKLPEQVRARVERRVVGRGFLGVYCGLPKPGTAGEVEGEAGHGGLEREVVLDGVRYRAFVYGSWEDQGTVREGTIEGVVLEDVIVLGDAPTPVERSGDAGGPVVMDAPNLTGTNTVLYIVARFSDETTDPIDDATALSQMQVVNNFWLNNSSGVVQMRGLVNPGQVMDIVHVTLPQPRSYGATYNANFGQLLGDARAAATSAGFNYASYNLDVVVTSNQSFSYAGRAYVGGQGAHLVRPYTSLRTAGHELGHNLGLYHADYWRSDGSHPFGKDSVPGGYVADVSNGEWVEYGHYFSVMGAQSGGELDDATKPHYAPAEKARLGWLSGAEVQYVSSGGVYRLFRHDDRGTAGTPRAIRIETPATDYTGNARRYWLGYRYAPWTTAQSWFRSGLQVDVARTTYGSDGATMLDMSPYSKDAASPFFDPANRPGSYWTIDNEDKRDGALVVGRTFSDTAAGIHVTPVAVGSNGTGEEYIDVVVELGQFPGNRPPAIQAFTATTNTAGLNQAVTFAVTASDPDGDVLAYAWDFDQVQVWTSSGLNAPTATKSWPAAGQYRVMVTVSDRRGGVATEALVVTVGAPANTRQIAGRVVWAGQPVYGARVSAVSGSTTVQAFTESDGSYVLTDLVATNSYTVACLRSGLTFTPQFANPVSVSAGNLYGRDFYANEAPVGGGAGGTYALSGQVTDAGVGVAGVEVEAGGKLAVTDAAGNYLLPGFPDGSYGVVARRSGWSFTPAQRTASVSGASVAGVNFSREAPFTLSGRFYNVPAGASDPAPRVWLSNGRSQLATRAGSGQSRYWSYSLTGVPAGSFSLGAELAGYAFTPSGFANPLAVSANRAGLDFNAGVASVAGAVSGRVTEQGVPRSGMRLEARQGAAVVASATTDTDGAYRIEGLAAGSYTVAPVAAGYSFSPASRSVGAVPSSGMDFAASGSSGPPVVASVTASPAVLSSASATTTLSASASGAGLLTYRWSAVTAPLPVGFSVNDSPGAASTAVAFQGGGDYLFQVRVTDANGLSTTGTVAVSVAAGAGSLVVSPYEVSVAAGQTVAFRADAWDSVGRSTVASPAWSATGGGSIDGSGMFLATTPGGPYEVTATAGGLVATARVWVTGTAVALPRVSVASGLSVASEFGSVAGTFVVTRVGAGNALALPVRYQLGGTAGNGTDYEALGGVVTIAAGSDSAQVAVVPLADGLVEGDETVVLTLEAGSGYQLEATSSAQVTLQDRPVDRWRKANFTAAELQNPAVSGDGADADGDGLANLLEYAFGLNPKVADGARGLVSGMENGHLTVQYRQNPEAVDVGFAIESAGELPGLWTAYGLTEVARVERSGYREITLREDAPASASVRRFVRLRVYLL